MNSSNDMTFMNHLLELRSRLIYVLFSISIFSFVGYYYSNEIINILLAPINDPAINIQALKITSIFMTKIMIGLFLGISLSFPVLVYNLLLFILPAFENKLNLKKIAIIVFVSLLLFLIGLLFGYKLIIPFSLSFFKSISLGVLDNISLNYTIENYLTYFLWILLICSTIYQLPIIIFILVRIKVLSLNNLKQYRRYLIVIFFIISALLTPPDPISQLLVAVPLILLYELTIILISIFFKK